MNFSRRTALRCGLASILTAAGPVWAAPPTICPPKPMRLARRLERGLSDGKAVTTEREWLVDFEVDGAGFVIDGKQVSVAVDAPAHLARLAAIEEQRDTSSMFPIALSRSGDIVDVGEVDDSDEMAETMKVALEIIEKAGLKPEDHRRNLAAIQAASAQLLESMPRDLFFPKATDWTNRRSLPLPGGHSGDIAVHYEAEKCPGKPWLERAERVVTTTVSGNSRFSREIWTLAPA